ncbi:MAG: UvrD-helicase domain-containing protein [Cyclobacteriaceae bacterium]
MPTTNLLTSEAPFHIYKSSAGSGKTYTLARNYVKLSLQAPDYFKHILAVTFTNRAAEEMKSRILLFLQKMAQNDHALVAELAQELREKEAWIVERSGVVLKRLLHEYSFFAVTTIDTFFHRIIKTFTREIGLQGGFQIEMDVERVLDESINVMFETLQDDKQLAKWLIRFSEERLLEGKSYDIKGEIVKLGSKLFSEEYKRLGLDLTGEINKEQILAIQKQLNAARNSFLSEMKAKAARIVVSIEQAGFGVDSFSYKKGGIAGYIYSLAAGDVKEAGARVLAAMVDAEKWYAKKDPQKEVLHQLVVDKLLPELLSLHQFMQEHAKDYYTAQELSRYLFTLGILQNLAEKVAHFRDENEVILISDLPDFLQGVIRDNDAPFIYEKVGNRYYHFLIDEFQDTSGFQWENFKPLVLNSLASGNFNMVVGDVKQSIYRWRGGDWEILLHKIEQEVDQSILEVKNLVSNRRSSGTVIDFNNSLYTQLPQLAHAAFVHALEGIDLPENQRTALLSKYDQLQTAYGEAFQDKPVETSAVGNIEVTFIEKEKGVTFKEQTTEKAIEQVRRLQDAGYGLSEIAFLVRSNSEAQHLVNAFMKAGEADNGDGYRYDVVSAEALYLRNSTIVKLLMSIFRYLLNDRDKIALTEVITTYLGKEGLDGSLVSSVTLKANPEELLPADFVTNKHTLLRLPVYELIEELIAMFGLNQWTDEVAYLHAFQDAVLDFSGTEKGDLQSFMTWWDVRGYKRTLPSEQATDAMEVLTIHKAKGLEFGVVILPFFDWTLDHETTFDNMIWVHDEYITHQQSLLPLKYTAALQSTHFAMDYLAEQSNAYLDNLNLIYVATTRAEQVLWINAPLPTNPQGLKTTADILYCALEPDLKDNQLQIGALPHRSDKPEPTELSAPTIFPTSSWREMLSIRISGKDVFDASRMNQISYGVLVHEVLSEMNVLSDMERSLENLNWKYGLTQEINQELHGLMVSLCEDAMIQDWYRAGREVHNEVGLLTTEGDQRRLDRVMIDGRHATVVDFKTGQPKSADQKQVQGYMELLRELGFQSVEGYLYYLGDKTAVKL